MLGRTDLKSRPDAFRSRAFASADLHERRTSGSTGVPLTIVQDPGKRRRAIADLISSTRRPDSAWATASSGSTRRGCSPMAARGTFARTSSPSTISAWTSSAWRRSWDPRQEARQRGPLRPVDPRRAGALPGAERAGRRGVRAARGHRHRRVARPGDEGAHRGRLRLPRRGPLRQRGERRPGLVAAPRRRGAPERGQLPGGAAGRRFGRARGPGHAGAGGRDRPLQPGHAAHPLRHGRPGRRLGRRRGWPANALPHRGSPGRRHPDPCWWPRLGAHGLGVRGQALSRTWSSTSSCRWALPATASPWSRAPPRPTRTRLATETPGAPRRRRPGGRRGGHGHRRGGHGQATRRLQRVVGLGVRAIRPCPRDQSGGVP